MKRLRDSSDDNGNEPIEPIKPIEPIEPPSVGPWLTRDALWAVLRFVPLRDVIMLRCVCRAWCTLIRERLTVASLPYQRTPFPWAALLRCSLHTFRAPYGLVVHLLYDPERSLPPTLRSLSLCAFPDEIRLSDLLRTAPRELSELSLQRLHQCAADVDAVFQLHALTSLRVLNVEPRKAPRSMAKRLAAALPALRVLEITGRATWVPSVLTGPLGTQLQQLTLHAPTATLCDSLTSARALVKLTVVEPAAQLKLGDAPLLQRLQVRGERGVALAGTLHGLQELSLSHTHEALVVEVHPLQLRSLRRLELRMYQPTAILAAGVRELATLEHVILEPIAVVDVHMAAALAALRRLVRLTVRSLHFSPGQVAALSRSLRMLEVTCCNGDGLHDIGLLDLHGLGVHNCAEASNAQLPRQLQVLCLAGITKLVDEIPLTPTLLEVDLTAVQRVEFSTWEPLRMLRALTVRAASWLPNTLVRDAEATLPSLIQIVLHACNRVNPPPPGSRGRFEVFAARG